MQIGWALRALERLHRARKKLPRLLLELQKVGGAQIIENAPQGRTVGFQEEELPPEALNLVRILVVL